MKVFSKNWGPALLVVLVAAVPYVVGNLYYLHLLNLVGIFTVAVTGLNILTGLAGQISMGHAAFFAIGAYSTAITTTRLGFPFAAAFVFSGLVGAMAGYAVGRPALRLKGAYLSMATMGVGEILQMVMRNWTGLTGGGLGIKRIPAPAILGFRFNTETRLFYLIWALALVIAWVTSRIHDSPMGRGLVALKDNETAAGAMGIDVAKFKVSAFMLSTVYAALAGSMFAYLNRYVSPDGFTFKDSVGFLCMVTAGGLGRKWGPVVGVSLLTLSKESFRVLERYQLVVYGLVLVGVILFMPKGVVGTLTDAFHKISRRKTGEQNAR